MPTWTLFFFQSWLLICSFNLFHNTLGTYLMMHRDSALPPSTQARTSQKGGSTNWSQFPSTVSSCGSGKKGERGRRASYWMVVVWLEYMTKELLYIVSLEFVFVELLYLFSGCANTECDIKFILVTIF